MNDGIIIYVVSWLVVYPLLLVLALLVFKFSYQHFREYKKRVDRMETVRRIEKKEKRR